MDGDKSTLASLALPDPQELEIPVNCFKCGESFTVPVKRFVIGNVLFCPHCFKSIVVMDNLNFQVQTTLKEVYENWEERLANFKAKRELEIREFQRQLDREVRDLEAEREQVANKLKDQLEKITETYNAPGRPARKRSIFAWG